MFRCLGIERKTKHNLADSSGFRKPGPCSAACESGGAGSLKSQACCRGLWLHVDFKGNATQLPVDVSCLLCSLTAHSCFLRFWAVCAFVSSRILWPGSQEAVHTIIERLGVPARDVELLGNPQVGLQRD